MHLEFAARSERLARSGTGKRHVATCTLLIVLASSCGHANSGPLGIDHELALDQNGIWARRYQTGLEYGVIAVEVGGALWFGNDNELGHTFWQSADASIISGIA